MFLKWISLHAMVRRLYLFVGDVLGNVGVGTLVIVGVGMLVGETRPLAAEAEVTERALERGAISRADYERRRAEDAAARAALNVKRARVASVRQKLQRFGLDEAALAQAVDGGLPSLQTELRAPFAGVVIATSVAEGELVAPDRELLTVASLGTVWV